MHKIPFDEIKNELDNTPHGGKRATVERYAEAFGVSSDTIYRGLRKRYGKQKEVKREKKIDRKLIDKIAIMKKSGELLGGIMTNSRSDRELATELCIEMLQNKGVEGAGELTVSSVNRILREEKGFRQRDPVVRVECEHANQEHQIDFSRSKYFQITDYDSELDDWILEVSGKELHYKKGDGRFRLWLVQLKDSYSRIRLARAYGATGESGLMGLEFLNFCYVREEDDHPLNYIPDVLKSDQGAFIKRKEVISVLEALDITPKKSKPYNKQAQGKIESGWHSIWQRFELKWAVELGKGTRLPLSKYNQELHKFMIKDMKREHPEFRDRTREQYYRIGIEQHPPREIDEDMMQHAFRVIYRTVDQSLRVMIDNVPWKCPSYAIDKRIRINVNMNGEMIGEILEEDRKQFTLQKFEYTKYDDFEHREHQTYNQEMEQEAKRLEKDKIKQKNRDKEWKELKKSIRKTEDVEADTVFNKTDEKSESEYFDNERHARKWIGKNLPGKDTFRDYEDIFLPLLKDTLKRKNIEQVVNKIGQMKTLKQEG